MLRLSLPTGLVVLVVVAAGDVASTQAPRLMMPPRDVVGTAPTGTGRLRGRVTSAETRSPLRRAQVSITSPEVSLRRMTTTDAEGRYEFAELPAGRFVITGEQRRLRDTPGGTAPSVRAWQSDRARRRPDAHRYRHRAPARKRDYRPHHRRIRRADCDGASPGAAVPVRPRRAAPAHVQRRRRRAARLHRRPRAVPRVRSHAGRVRRQRGREAEQMAMALGPGSANDSTEGFAPTFYPGTINVADAQPVTLGLGAGAHAAYSALGRANGARVGRGARLAGQARGRRDGDAAFGDRFGRHDGDGRRPGRRERHVHAVERAARRAFC